MTLENLKRLLKHYEDTNQTARANDVKKNLTRKESMLKPKKKPEEEPKEVPKNAKKR